MNCYVEINRFPAFYYSLQSISIPCYSTTATSADNHEINPESFSKGVIDKVHEQNSGHASYAYMRHVSGRMNQNISY